MGSEISRKVHNIMAREMGSMGKFIISKQCKDIGLDPEQIAKDDLLKLSQAIGKVMIHFGGSTKAVRIEDEIKKIH
jgi:hypothetical protein